VELNEAARRILGRHKGLICGFVLLGCVLGAALHIDEDPLYSATARLVLDITDPQSQEESQAIADTARGIATGPSLIKAAVADLSVSRDAKVLAEEYVNVAALGSSGVLALTVTDRDPRIAVDLANALARGVISTRRGISTGQVSGVLDEIDDQVANLTGQIRNMDETLDTIAGQIARATSVEGVRTLEALRSEVERQRSYLEQRRVTLESARAGIMATQAERPQASIVDPASLPADPVPSGLPISVAVGALLGLLLGIALAATIETFSPTVVGKVALERETEAPILGELPAPPDHADRIDVGTVASHLAMAGATAQVDRIELIAIDRGMDLRGFARQLEESIPGNGGRPTALDIVAVNEKAERAKPPTSLEGHPGPANDVRGNGHRRSGLVVVTPEAVKRTSLDPVLSFRVFSGSPLLGIIVYQDRGLGRSQSPSGARRAALEASEERRREPRSSKPNARHVADRRQGGSHAHPRAKRTTPEVARKHR
jgi:capsular polysaccharide biosynthesis protein